MYTYSVILTVKKIIIIKKNSHILFGLLLKRSAIKQSGICTISKNVPYKKNIEVIERITLFRFNGRIILAK